MKPKMDGDCSGLDDEALACHSMPELCAILPTEWCFKPMHNDNLRSLQKRHRTATVVTLKRYCCTGYGRCFENMLVVIAEIFVRRRRETIT